jgi:hypothetical protein
VRVEGGHAVTHDHHYPRLKQLWQRFLRQSHRTGAS